MRKRGVSCLLGAVLVMLSVFVTLKSYIPDNFDVEIGDICPDDIFATGEIVDEVTTEKLREQAEQLVQPDYKINTEKTAQSQNAAEKYLSGIRKGSISSVLNVTSADTELISALDDEAYQKLLLSVKKTIEAIMSASVTAENIDEKKASASEELKKFGVGEGAADAASAVVSASISINTVADKASFEAAKKEAAANVEPVVYRKGAKIIGKGEVIEENHYKMMAQLGFIKEKTPMNIISHVGRAVLVVLLLVLLYTYLLKKKNFSFDDFGAYCFVIIMQMLAVLLFSEEQSWSLYLTPLIVVPISLALMFDSRIAITTNIVTSFIAAVAFDAGLDLTISAIVSGTVVSYMLSKTVSRNKVVYASLLTALLSGFIVLLYNFGTNASLRPTVQNSLLSAGGIMIGCVVSIGLIPVTETVFGVLTQFKLAEYVNFDNKLLKRMIMEAPGTYHHSLMVGNLAENAANEVGANSLLCRVGAYFHDVGKLAAPQMFKENQYSDNPHDFMQPHESAEYILAHPVDGVKLAAEAKLPRKLVDFIFQHHGTTAAAYFYHKAKQLDENTDINEYRYKCRKPQSKEVAIVMLADTVEAAMRSAPDFTAEETDDFIGKLIKAKADDGQFDECDISFSDLVKIKKSFAGTLKGYFHKRVAYPEQGGRENEDGRG